VKAEQRVQHRQITVAQAKPLPAAAQRAAL